MKRLILALICLTGLHSSLKAQKDNPFIQIGGKKLTYHGLVKSILDKNDNIVTVGMYTDSNSIGYVDSPATTSFSARHIVNFYIAKFDSHGHYQWLHTFGTNSIGEYDFVTNFEVGALSSDKWGNIYLAFDIKYLQIDKNHTFFNTDHYAKMGGVLLKYAPDGRLIWGKTITSLKDMHLHFLSTDTSGNIIIGGNSFNEFPSGYPVTDTINIGTANLHSKGESISFVAKLDSGANVIWASLLHSNKNYLNLSNLALSKRGEIYTTLYTDSSFSKDSTSIPGTQKGYYFIRMDRKGDIQKTSYTGSDRYSINSMSVSSDGFIYGKLYFYYFMGRRTYRTERPSFDYQRFGRTV